MRKQKPIRIIPRPAIKITVIVIIVGLGILLIAGSIMRALKLSDYFKIREVITSEGSTINLSYLKGENIFALDLSEESRYILEHYPTYRNIRLVRILPDRIFVDFLKRKTIALVKLYRIFSVDQDAVLFEAPQDLADSELPLITGLETKIFGPKVDRKYNLGELTLALDTVRTFKINRLLRFYKVKKIDVTNPNEILVFVALPAKDIAGWLQIKVGKDGLRNKVNILATLLVEAKGDLPNIKYIDLRFKDPLIKLKDSNAK